jgi:amidase
VPTVIFPAGTNDHGQPINFQLEGREWDDAKLLGYAFAFEAKANGHVETAAAPSLTYKADATPKPIVIAAAPAPVTAPPAGLPAPIVEGAPVKAVPLPTGKVVSTKLKVSSKGKVSVKVSCTSTTAACTVQVVLTRSGKTIGKKTVTVQPGKTATATFTVSAATRKSINRGKKLTAFVSLVGKSGSTSTAKAKVSLSK